MVLVMLSALFTAALYVLFKLFDRRKVPLLPAIVVNYIVAFLFGLFYSTPWTAGDISLLWLPSALQGGLFILLFHLIGSASQRIGISPTTVASKMSLALTVMITVLIFREQPSALAWSGIALAVLGVTFSSWGGGTRGAKGWWLLPVIFFASAISDVLINASQRTRVTPMTEAVFPTMIFGFAALFGLCWLVFRADRIALLQPRTWFWGALLGGVNYASIFFLVLALSRGGLQASSVFPLANVGVILFGTAASIVLFKERLRAVQWVGIVLSIAALGLIISAPA
ncbi:MAG: DMT family transporter [Flavobacteriales bacterium]